MEEDCQKLKARWLAGVRKRELGLRLMFLAWMHWAEPPFLTGLPDDPHAEALWREIFLHFGGEHSADVEFLFAAGTMAGIFPHVLGNEAEWRDRGSRMRREALRHPPSRLSPSTFAGRGEYGKYFAHQLRGVISRDWH